MPEYKYSDICLAVMGFLQWYLQKQQKEKYCGMSRDQIVDETRFLCGVDENHSDHEEVGVSVDFLLHTELETNRREIPVIEGDTSTHMYKLTPAGIRENLYSNEVDALLDIRFTRCGEFDAAYAEYRRTNKQALKGLGIIYGKKVDVGDQKRNGRV